MLVTACGSSSIGDTGGGTSAPVISSFTATPASIQSGQSSTLSWSVTGATSLSIDQGIGAVTGTSRGVSPGTTTTYTLTATNSAGSVTGATTVTVTPAPANPVPSIGSISPSASTAGGTAFTLTVNGSDFLPSSSVRWGGSPRVTAYVDQAHLTASITAADIGAAGTAAVTVFNPAPGGGTSSPVQFTASNPAPAAGSLSPASLPAGSSAFTLTVNGTGFVSTSTVQWNGLDRATSYVNATRLTASIAEADVATEGMASVSVVNPAPGGGASPTIAFPVTQPDPATNIGTLLLDAYSAAGNRISAGDFSNYTNYIVDPPSTQWGIYYNYGVYRMGTPPATAQAGSVPFDINQNGITYIGFVVPAGQDLYLTALWGERIDKVGTVFLRADDEGTGFKVGRWQSRIVELPLAFAWSELHAARAAFTQYTNSGITFPPDIALALDAATNQLLAAQSLSTGSARALAAYAALSSIVPLKENVVLEAVRQATTARSDFMFTAGWSNYIEPSAIPHFELYRQAGFDSVNIVCNWTVLAPHIGTYDFTSLDFQINQATSLGFNVVLNILENPGNGTIPPAYRLLPFPELKRVYYDHAAAVVSRYAANPAVAVIYPASEMEVDGSYSLAELAELTQQALQGARDAAPLKEFGVYFTATGHVGYQMSNPPANDFTTLEFMKYLIANGIKPDFAGIQAQYGTIFAPLDLHRFLENLSTIHDVLNVPLYVADTTYSSKTEDLGVTSRFYWHGGLTQQAQAEWASGVLTIAYGTSWIKGLTWTHDDSYDPSSTGIWAGLVGTDLLLRDGVPKLAYPVFKNFISSHQ